MASASLEVRTIVMGMSVAYAVILGKTKSTTTWCPNKNSVPYLFGFFGFGRFVSQRVRGFGDALELWFTLEIQENGCFLDVAGLEDALDNLIAVQRFAGIFQNLSDNIGDSTPFIAPFFESVDAAADQDEARIFD